MKQLPAIGAAMALSAAATAAFAFPGAGPDAMLTKADANKDGVVTRAEFAAMRGETFARLDRNSDGIATLGELPRLARSDRPEARQLRATLTAADVNKDGKVTRDEFVKAPSPLFERADVNRDNRLDSREIADAKARLKTAQGSL
jgi:Ca2+-binding EF-hand superfamily protein